MSFLTDLQSEKQACLGLARSYTPFKTGNLRYNSISVYDTAVGFNIEYKLSNAYYIYFLEEGTSKSKKWVGFIANRTVPAIASYLNAKFSTKNEDLLKYYEDRILRGNYDIFVAENNEKMLGRREAKAYDSYLADKVNYGHISNEFSWKHNAGIEMENIDINKKI
jgi:hypothetical protein